MKAALGVLTSSGGMTSHAAVVARGMGRTCIVGCESISVDEKKQQLILEDGSVLYKGQLLTLDGSSGEVMEGRVPTINTSEDQDSLTILSWADKYRRLKIRTNAETTKEAQKARQLGAEGIGLCQTENMFFGKERMHVMREMVLAQTRGELQKKLERLSSFQISDLKKLFQVMDGLPVTIRLLDTPLKDFFPTSKTEIKALAEKCGYESEGILRQIQELDEINPVLGFRGCRLSIVYPEIAAMQMDAVLTAAIQSQQNGLNIFPEIIIPLVATSGELEVILQVLEQTAQQTFHRLGERIA